MALFEIPDLRNRLAVINSGSLIKLPIPCCRIAIFLLCRHNDLIIPTSPYCYLLLLLVSRVLILTLCFFCEKFRLILVDLQALVFRKGLLSVAVFESFPPPADLALICSLTTLAMPCRFSASCITGSCSLTGGNDSSRGTLFRGGG